MVMGMPQINTTFTFLMQELQRKSFKMHQAPLLISGVVMPLPINYLAVWHIRADQEGGKEHSTLSPHDDYEQQGVPQHHLVGEQEKSQQLGGGPPSLHIQIVFQPNHVEQAVPQQTS